MSFDMLRLAIVYYPITFLFVAFMLGFFLRDLIDFGRMAWRVLRRKHHRRGVA